MKGMSLCRQHRKQRCFILAKRAGSGACFVSYLSELILAEKNSLLNIAIEPATTALALLRACSNHNHIVMYVRC